MTTLLAKSLEIDMTDNPSSPDYSKDQDPNFPKFKHIKDRSLPKYKHAIVEIIESLRQKQIIFTELSASKIWKENTLKMNSDLVCKKLKEIERAQRVESATIGLRDEIDFHSFEENEFVDEFVDDIPNPAIHGVLDPLDTTNLTTSKAIVESSKLGSRNTTNGIQLQPSVLLPFIEPIPKMNHWLPVQKNIVVEDEITPFFASYFGDNNCSNQELYQELNEMDNKKLEEQEKSDKYRAVLDKCRYAVMVFSALKIGKSSKTSILRFWGGTTSCFRP